MKDKIRGNILFCMDVLLIQISILLAYVLKLDGQFIREFRQYLPSLVGISLVATIAKTAFFTLFRLYKSLWGYAGTYELLNVMAAALAGNAVMFAYTMFVARDTPRSIFIITFFVDVILIGGIRFAYRIFRRLLQYHSNNAIKTKRIMVIGAGEAGAVIIRELKYNPRVGSVPVAVIDDNPQKVGKKLMGVPVVGNRSDIGRVAVEKKIDEIIIAIPSAPKKEINSLVDICSKTRCKVRIVPSVSELIDGSVSIQRVRDVDIEDLLGREPIKLDIESISSYLSGQVVMVTGGGGSIGSELCRQVAGFKPKQLIILDNYENNAYDIQNELLDQEPGLDLVTVIANIRELRRLENIFRKYRPDVVFHAAAHKHVPLMENNPTEAIKNNVFGTQNVAECADKFGVKRFVLISTDKAVNPTNIMGATKRIAEMIIQSYNRHSETVFSAVRFGNVLGSNGSVIPLFKKQIAKGGPVTVTHPDITRFFMTIPEAVQLVIEAGGMAKGGEIFVLDMGKPVKIVDLARNLIRLSGFEPEVDIEIKYTGLRPGEKLHEELLMAEEGLQSTKNDMIYVAPCMFSDYITLKKEINHLNEIIADNREDIMEYIPRIVPTYRKAQ